MISTVLHVAHNSERGLYEEYDWNFMKFVPEGDAFCMWQREITHKI